MYIYIVAAVAALCKLVSSNFERVCQMCPSFNAYSHPEQNNNSVELGEK